MSGKKDSEELEPTIVPVRRPVADATSIDPGTRPTGRPPWLLIFALGLALAGVVAVFVWLPPPVEPAPPLAEPEPIVEVLPPTPEPVLSEAERARLREQAADLLILLQQQRQTLDALSAASWGDLSWSSYENASRQADDAFVAENLTEAVSRYEAALAIGDALLERSANIVGEALAAGAAAIESGDAELAAEQYALALGIEPDNAAALRGARRAAALPDVLAAMNRGDAADEAGDLAAAAAAYREALSHDADWSPARRALDSVNTRIADARFESLLDEAYARLAEGRNEQAAEAFGRALAMRADSPAAREGLERAEQGIVLDAVRMSEVRGKASERTENWEQAIARYREALAADSSLRFAIEGLERAQLRADLATKVQALIDTPRLLLNDATLEDSRKLLDEARAIEEPGPRHLAQIEQLARLIDLASTPIPVTLVSDGLTEVSVYRVDNLGSFTEKALELRPGDYIAVGQRRGFRDVRMNFSVLPGVAREPVLVVCTEPI